VLAVAVADVKWRWPPDLINANQGYSDTQPLGGPLPPRIAVSVLLGNGNGTFQVENSPYVSSYAVSSLRWPTSTAMGSPI